MRQGYKPDLGKIVAEAYRAATPAVTPSRETFSVCQNPGCDKKPQYWDRFCSTECHTRATSYEASIWLRFRMTLDDYNRMLTAQGGTCAICHARPSGKRPRLHIDHDHVTGKVRGLLCGDCNRALGGARDNVKILRAMIGYLNHHHAPVTEVQTAQGGLW